MELVKVAFEFLNLHMKKLIIYINFLRMLDNEISLWLTLVCINTCFLNKNCASHLEKPLLEKIRPPGPHQNNISCSSLTIFWKTKSTKSSSLHIASNMIIKKRFSHNKVLKSHLVKIMEDFFCRPCPLK